VSRKRRKSIAPGERAEGALPLLETPFADEPEPVADDEIVGVERTGAHEPLSMESTGASVALDVDESDELPAVLSSVAGEVLDPPALPGLPETDRTAAYDPPPELFADIPDPEANPVPVAFHNQATNFIPVARVERGEELAAPAPAPAPAPVPTPAREERAFSLFDPEPGPDDAAATRARPAAPAPAPAPAPTPVASPGKAAPRGKKPTEKPHRPPGPMHRPVARDPAPAPASKADPAENELTGIYEPPEVVPELPRGKLTIVEGENTGKSYFLNRNRSMVGRGIDNDIVLMDIAVSRKHFRVDRHAEGFKVVDLASGNGTTLNGKRVTEAELYDGDRIDLGNTTIEFLSVGRTRNRLPAGTPGTEEAPITDHGRSQTPISPVRGAAGGPRIPWTWVGLWAAATFLAVLVVLVLVRRHRADAPGDASGAAARAHVELAESAMRARDWKRAEEELTVARQLGPELVAQVPFDDHVARIARERDAQRRLDDARRKVGIEPPAAVQALLLGIGRDSVYYSEARNLIAELDTLAEANRAASNGSAAPTPGPTPVQTPTASPTPAPPTAAAAPEIRAEPARVEPAKVAAGRPEVAANAGASAGAETEKRAKADISEALRLYRDEKFDDAAAALEKAARRAPGTKTAKDAQGKARAVREFADQWAAAQKALRSRRAREASDALSRAAATDRRLGGHHREKIDGQLAEQLYMVAIQAYNRQAYDEAVQANGRVLEISPGHGLATRLQDKMRRSAMLIARQAQQALDSGDRDGAKRLAQAALKLVNESDGAGKAARKVLDKL
jgi:hypothetical protein